MMKMEEKHANNVILDFILKMVIAKEFLFLIVYMEMKIHVPNVYLGQIRKTENVKYLQLLLTDVMNTMTIELVKDAWIIII